MGRVFEAYRAVHEQGFVPIFVQDDFDSRDLVEACLSDGIRVIEYTLRRPDAPEMIPWIRKTYPDLYLMAGSTLDDEGIVEGMRRRHPQLMTLQQLADAGVDGFVSMLGWSLESIRKYSPTHVVIPSAHSATQAFLQTGGGAHFQKLSGAHLDLVRQCRMAPTFEFCPIFVTGGISDERMREATEAGAVLLASGFDVMLKGRPTDIGVKEIAEALSLYVETAQQSRKQVWPEVAAAVGADRQAWLDSLPHYHPF